VVDLNGIYYLGPEGSFSHEAASLINGKLIGEVTISSVFKRVSENRNSLGVIPIENSLEGPVNETLDNLYNYDDIYIINEIERKIELVLASKTILTNNIKRLYSHPYAFSEARDPEAAAICSIFAAKLYNLNVLLTGLNSDNNYTRFIVISKEKKIYGEKSMILFTVPHKPGALFKVLQVFYEYGINISMIYSRPLKSIPWQYYFYLEYEGNTANVEFIEKLRKVTHVLKIKGSFSKIR
jgi:prephenate dehydratase